jgi:hypothetical protein
MRPEASQKWRILRGTELLRPKTVPIQRHPLNYADF